MPEESIKINPAFAGGVCGLCMGVLAVPLVPTLSAAFKTGVFTLAPVIGLLGVTMGIGAAMGAAVGSSMKS